MTTKWLRYAWQIIVGIFTVAVVLSAYQVAEYSGNVAIYKIIISGVALCVIQLTSFSRLWATTQIDQTAAILLGLRDIKKKLKLDIEEDDEIKEALKKKEELKKKAIIPSIFDYIVWVIVILYLIGNAFSY